MPSVKQVHWFGTSINIYFIPLRKLIVRRTLVYIRTAVTALLTTYSITVCIICIKELQTQTAYIVKLNIKS